MMLRRLRLRSRTWTEEGAEFSPALRPRLPFDDADCEAMGTPVSFFIYFSLA
jgi:hypothetical protein